MPASAALTAPASPLSQDRVALLARLTDGLDSAGLWWLSGYAAGLARAQAWPDARPDTRPAAVAATGAMPAPTLTVLYGSQTGNAQRLAQTLARQAEDAGMAVRLLRIDAYPLRELKNEHLLYVVISTHGDGDPPEDARAFFDFIAGRRAPHLQQLKYAVLGLGDSSYPQFCSVGRMLDARLAELGGVRLLDRGDADVDIDSIAAPWLAQALAAAREALKSSAAPANVTALRPVPSGPLHGRDAPFAAELHVNQRITGTGSDRDIRHVELTLEGSGLHYQPGDALGVWPTNPVALVEALLAMLGLDGDRAVTHGGQSLPLRQWLAGRREITRLSRPFVVAHAARAGSGELQRLLAPERVADLAALIAQQQVIDLLRAHPGAWSGDELVAALRPLAPRLYSIASSQKVVGDEAHLTVAHVQYRHAGATRWGAASHFLASRRPGDALPVYIERNERFRLPADASRDVIMIGPGTGVAPFRGFVQERTAIGAGGRHWLLFGNPHFRSDFLYQLEWQRALKTGQLQRIDLAFSRDGAQKTYVQQRLREHGRDLYDWLRNGAHLYVCGATAMGKDVHAALLDIVTAHNGNDADAAGEFINDLHQQGRYARDVY